MKYLKKFSTDTDRIAYESSSNYIEPYVSLVSEDSSVHYNSWADEYFTTIAREDGTISFNIRFDMGTNYITSISYSTNNGETWNTTNNVDNKSEHLVIDVNVERGDKILWKGTATQLGCWSPDEEVDDLVGSFFSSDCEFDAQGNIMSLLYGNNFKDKTVFKNENEYVFSYLFSDYDRNIDCLIVNARNLLLPATTLTRGCYCYMFRGCTNLVTAPELPATTLANNCYYCMFQGCTSLTSAPELPVTTLAEGCYSSMFADCTNITTAPVLPATTLAKGCYSSIFSGWTSLTIAPELPATTLASNCYRYMFRGCTSLTSAPELPATTLASNCYSSMFADCTNITTAPVLPATTLAEGCYQYMFNGCTSLTSAPELPATTLANNCYYCMFQGCTSLATAPQLPVTTLASGCYSSMFYRCTSLTSAPALPATTLASNCYDSMFQSCTSLTTAPELPATTLANNCYYCMFQGCTSLNYIKAMFTTTPGFNYTGSWVYGVASNGTFVKNAAATWDVTGVHGIPSGWTIQTYNPYVEEYFTTVARENGTISFNIWKSMGTDIITSMSYSTDDGETWNTTNNTDNKSEHLVIDVDVNEGDKVLWKGSASQLGYYDKNEDTDDVTGSFFSSTCKFDAQGNIMSLLYGDNYKNQMTIEETDVFAWLFSDFDEEKTCGVVNAKDLSLPATTLAEGCYAHMFNNCTSLTTAPELPATTLAGWCYESMFQECTSLTTAPELPATTLATYCYSSMFYGCTSLTTAPELPVTTLVEGCYKQMFSGCTSLTTAPELPATTLARYCYYYMFYGCTNLNYIKAMFITTPSNSYTSNWVSGVAASGTFVKNAAATWTTTGINGIPNGWTVETATE